MADRMWALSPFFKTMKVEILPGATDDDTEADLGAQEVEKTVEKKYLDILYDQNRVNPY